MYNDKMQSASTKNKKLNSKKNVIENTNEKKVNLYLKLHIANHRPG